MNDRWLAALRLIGVGWFVVICILLGVLGGHWLDEKTGLSPLWLLIGLFTGIFAAFYGVYRMLPRIINRRNKGNG